MRLYYVYGVNTYNSNDKIYLETMDKQNKVMFTKREARAMVQELQQQQSAYLWDYEYHMEEIA